MASRIATSIDHEGLQFFDLDEHVTVQTSPLNRGETTCSLLTVKQADPDKRLIPSAAATTQIQPIVPDEPDPLTQLHLHGEYQPPTRSNRLQRVSVRQGACPSRRFTT